MKTETLAKVFPCKFFGIFKNIYFEEHLQTAGSARNPTDIPYLSLFSMYCNPLGQKYGFQARTKMNTIIEAEKGWPEWMQTNSGWIAYL